MQDQMPNNNQPLGNVPPVMPSGMNMPPQMPNQNKSSIGSIIGTIIVIAIIILGGLYFWGKRVDEAKMNQDLVSGQSDTSTVPAQDENMEANSIKAVSNGDDLNSIEADLKATNYDNLGAELNQ